MRLYLKFCTKRAPPVTCDCYVLLGSGVLPEGHCFLGGASSSTGEWRRATCVTKLLVGNFFPVPWKTKVWNLAELGGKEDENRHLFKEGPMSSVWPSWPHSPKTRSLSSKVLDKLDMIAGCCPNHYALRRSCIHPSYRRRLFLQTFLPRKGTKHCPPFLEKKYIPAAHEWRSGLNGGRLPSFETSCNNKAESMRQKWSNSRGNCCTHS